MINSKKFRYIVILIVVLLLFILNGCSKPINIPENSVTYVSYANGDYTIYFIDPTTAKTLDSVKIGEGYGDRLFKDTDGNFWAPLQFKPDSTNAENRVLIFDPKGGKTKDIKVGLHPFSVNFIGDFKYIVCIEDGFTPNVYRFNNELKGGKYLKMPDLGLIFDVTQNKDNLYIASLVTKKDKQLPMLTKVNLKNKTIHSKLVSKESKGISNILFFNNKLYLGMEDPIKTVTVFDPNSLNEVGKLDYTEPMVGELQRYNNDEILITNYSRLLSKGGKITFYSLSKNKVLRSFDTKSLAEHVSVIHNKLYIVDNTNNKMYIYDLNGKLLNEVDIPTMVTNLMSYK
ncbi:hypothetical protein AB7942_30000 [Neobacillus sp. BF23-41]|uniref:hypothetical protein n=1 Tax=Neobacillus sp. BF23-41 TaxID=3240280 RepID=UPI0034E5A2B4